MEMAGQKTDSAVIQVTMQHSSCQSLKEYQQARNFGSEYHLQTALKDFLPYNTYEGL